MKLNLLCSACVLTIACNSADDEDGMIGPPQCDATGYVAFDPANYGPQDLRLGAFDDMVELMDEAEESPSLAAPNFAEARRLYQQTAELQTKVMGRVDEHFADPFPIGSTLDSAIVEALAEGETATTSLAIDIAKEKVEKTMLHFFYLSIYFEMVQGERKTWDEAYGYWGAGTTNQESSRRGLSAVATERDGTNNTNLADTIFNGVVDGSCALAKALGAGGAEPVDVTARADLRAVVDQIDRDMQKVLAYYAGHEAFEMTEQQELLETDPEASAEIEVELLELDLLFKPLEPLMILRGGASQERALRIRMVLDAAMADETGAWKTTIDPNEVIADLEAEFSIDIRG